MAWTDAARAAALEARRAHAMAAATRAGGAPAYHSRHEFGRGQGRVIQDSMGVRRTVLARAGSTLLTSKGLLDISKAFVYRRKRG